MPIPAKYSGDERKEVETELKTLDAQMVKPLEVKSQEILKVCVDKAAEFHVSNEYSIKCRERIKKIGRRGGADRSLAEADLLEHALAQ